MCGLVLLSQPPTATTPLLSRHISSGDNQDTIISNSWLNKKKVKPQIQVFFCRAHFIKSTPETPIL